MAPASVADSSERLAPPARAVRLCRSGHAVGADMCGSSRHGHFTTADGDPRAHHLCQWMRIRADPISDLLFWFISLLSLLPGVTAELPNVRARSWKPATPPFRSPLLFCTGF